MPLTKKSFHFVPNDYTENEEIFNSALACHSGDESKCVDFAYALGFSSSFNRNIPLSRAILESHCVESRNPQACFYLGNLLKRFSNSKTEDGIALALESYKSSCILGDPKGCRLYAEISYKYGIDYPDKHYLLWNLVGLQNGKEYFEKQQNSIEKKDDIINEDNEKKSVIESLIPNQKIHLNKPYYTIPNNPYSNLNLEYHYEISKIIDNILKINNLPESINLIDLNDIKNRNLQLNSKLFQYKINTIYRSNIEENAYKKNNGYFISNRIHSNFSIISKFINIPIILPIELNDKIITKQDLENLGKYHWNEAINGYENMCIQSKEREETFGCYHLGRILKEVYDSNNNDKSNLSESIKALKKGCSKNQNNCCRELSEMYTSTLKYSDVPNNIADFNHKRAKYYAYQTCNNNPTDCLMLGEILLKEGDRENALKMLIHSCEVGNNIESCNILKSINHNSSN